METVWRVEWPATGVGPYCNTPTDHTKIVGHMKMDHNDNLSAYPSWWMFSFIYGKDHLAGFRSVSDLADWFGEHLSGLMRLGYKIKEYQATEVYDLTRAGSFSQCMFLPSATRTSTSQSAKEFV